MIVCRAVAEDPARLEQLEKVLCCSGLSVDPRNPGKVKPSRAAGDDSESFEIRLNMLKVGQWLPLPAMLRPAPLNQIRLKVSAELPRDFEAIEEAVRRAYIILKRHRPHRGAQNDQFLKGKYTLTEKPFTGT